LGAALASLNWSDEPADYSYFAQAGRHLLSGQLSDVYRDPGNQGGPFELLAAAVFQAMIPGRLDLFVLQVGGAALLVVAAAAGVHALRRHFQLPPLPALSLGLAAVVAVWEVPGYALDGHAAELAIPAMWLISGLLMQGGRSSLVAALLGLSCGWEPWGALGLPILLGSPRPAWRLIARAAIAASAGAILYVPFILSGEFRMFEHRWLIGTDTLPHLLGVRGEFSWWMRLLQGCACIVVGSAVAWRSRGSRHALWLVPLVVIQTRLLLDPVDPYGYYFVVPQLLALTGVALLHAEPARVKVGVVALAYAQFLVTEDSLRLPLLALSLAGTCVLAAAVRPRDQPPSSELPGSRRGIGGPTRPGWASARGGGPAGR
jgi:hypothetical protein